MPLWVGARRSLLYAPAVVVAGGGDATETTNYLTRADGVATVTAPYRAGIQALINGMVADGDFVSFDGIWPRAYQSEALANLNLVSSSFPITKTGAGQGTFSPGHGDPGAGDGSADYISFGIAGSTATKWTQTSACVMVYRRSAGDFFCEDIGTGDTTCHFSCGDANTPGQAGAFLNMDSWSGAAASALASSGIGLWAADRTGTTIQIYKNGATSGSSNTTSSSQAPSASVFRTGQGGGAAAVPGAALYAIGAHLSSAAHLRVNNRIATFMTAVGGP
jgi:hypothetical protein